ncbi:MAG TPA: toprim domain-containing protein, partial [Pirellulales bacterium]|nr:toprim domain-containing protein [Pirellulales bacterium]
MLCESAIDSISCFQLHPQHVCISTSGVRANPPWLRALLAAGYQIHCGFDADAHGDAAAARMTSLHGAINRLRPPDHDWNDVLRCAIAFTWTPASAASEKTGKTVPLPDESLGACGTDARCG